MKSLSFSPREPSINNIQIRDEREKLTLFMIDDSTNLPSKLLQYINEALKISYEDEVLTLMVAGIYHLMYLHNPDIIVEVLFGQHLSYLV